MGKFQLFSSLPFFYFLLALSSPILSKPAKALPLSTRSRWIVDEGGQRVKLSCVNWVSHLDAVVAEGLSKQPIDVLSKWVLSMGFNCVRLTWPLFLATNDSLAALTVRQSFQSLGLTDSLAGIQSNNPSMVDLPLIKAYQAVVANLGENNVMVILDNHISKPGWCCSNTDDNGFFGDRYFDPYIWILGLTNIAAMFKGVANVVGMSLRDELRGPRQNVDDWFKYMQLGAERVHATNPDLLVILSGLSYDKDLSFLHSRQVNLTFTRKLVYEAHWYAFSDGSAWESGNPNEVCGQVMENFMNMSGFLVKQGWPLFVSEFGVDQRGTNVNDNRYINCFLAMAADLDLDWALWTFVGNYYLREGVVGMEEFYGMLNLDGSNIRNSSYLQKISALQPRFQGVGETVHHKVIFHPLTGMCVLRASASSSMQQPLKLGPCPMSDGWKYTPQNILTLKGTYFCLQADRLGQPAKLGTSCSKSNSKWQTISNSKLHLSSLSTNGFPVCLDVDMSTNAILTKQCNCLSRDRTCDPASQWFKLVTTTRRSRSSASVPGFSSLRGSSKNDVLFENNVRFSKN